MSLEGKKITGGLTGGIACYKVPYLIRSLIKNGAEVQVIMTEAAPMFITPLTLVPCTVAELGNTILGTPNSLIASNMFKVP